MTNPYRPSDSGEWEPMPSDQTAMLLIALTLTALFDLAACGGIIWAALTYL